MIDWVESADDCVYIQIVFFLGGGGRLTLKFKDNP